MKGQRLLTKLGIFTISHGQSTSCLSSVSLGSALSQASSRVLLAAPSCRHSLVPSPVSSAAPSCVPSCVQSCAPSCAPSCVPSCALSCAPSCELSYVLSCTPSITPLPLGLPQLEVSPNVAGGQEEEGYDSDTEERATGFLLDTEEDGPMMIERDNSEI